MPPRRLACSGSRAEVWGRALLSIGCLPTEDGQKGAESARVRALVCRATPPIAHPGAAVISRSRSRSSLLTTNSGFFPPSGNASNVNTEPVKELFERARTEPSPPSLLATVPRPSLSPAPPVPAGGHIVTKELHRGCTRGGAPGRPRSCITGDGQVASWWQ
ncbi:hypothetical protein NDU88_004164 [Pleurodeles waltl]|uniref:Uncharacterized protein n=1 Tax=Pleurodeles waltl TaxID=8319 RepID=A0AAV7T796_PLEWA|nr:hypothetical protein NDU88_004164 [Pleurodeles waltl]